MLPIAIDQLVTRLRALPFVERVWLFGSRARGDEDPRSDVDLAIEAGAATDRDWLVEEVDTLLPIDLARLDQASDVLRARVLREGKLLHERRQGPR